MLASPEALLMPLWRHRNLVADQRPLLLEADDRLRQLASEPVFLGLSDGSPCFAFALPAHQEAPGWVRDRGSFDDLRRAGPFMTPADAELAAYARGLTHWHRHHRHCGKCGAATSSGDGGHVRMCDGCGKKHFPRTDPAIMALIVRGDSCLLARQPSWPAQMFSVLAGFVEPGESLEDAVHREVREEVGIEVDDVRYVRSQPWPFPSSLMLGFVMRAVSDEIQLGDDELEQARWVTVEQLRLRQDLFWPPVFSLAGQLIQLFLDGELSS